MPTSSHNPTPAPPGHVWSEEASRLLGLSVKTLHNYRYLGKGPFSFRVGRKIAYPLDGPNGLRAWFDAQRNPIPNADAVNDSRAPEPRRLSVAAGKSLAAAA